MAHADTPKGDFGRTEKRTPRSIRFHDLEWERIETFAEERGLAAAEFVRFAALAAIGEGAPGGSESGSLDPLIERTFRYAYMMATKMRAEMLSQGRGEELEALIGDARGLQDDLLQLTRADGSLEEHDGASA